MTKIIDRREYIRRARVKNAELEARLSRLDRSIRFLEYRRDGMTFREIADIERLSIERVRQICIKAQRMAEHWIKRKEPVSK